MKKILFSLLFVGLIMFGLTGCGKKEQKELSLGDTYSGNNFELTVNSVDYGKYVVSTLSSPDYYTITENGEDYFYGVDGTRYKNPSVADSGKVLVAFDADLKYKGKSAYSNHLEGIFQLLYGDGYSFNVKSAYILKDGKWIYIDGTSVNHQTISFEVLDSNTYKIRGYFEVPEEVKNNTSEPLKLSINKLGDTGTYKIR